MTVRFFVPGTPVPQGSLRSFAHRSSGKVVTPQSSRVVEWRQAVAWHAREHFAEPFAVPVIVECDFAIVRPKTHYGTGRNAGTLKPSAPTHIGRPPDVDKLCRAVLDGLSGVAFVDDALVVDLYATKTWANKSFLAGVHVRIGEAGERIGASDR